MTMHPSGRPILKVNRVKGRYPCGINVMRPENMYVDVRQIDWNLFRISIHDDSVNDYWMEFTVELTGVCDSTE